MNKRVRLACYRSAQERLLFGTERFMDIALRSAYIDITGNNITLNEIESVFPEIRKYLPEEDRGRLSVILDCSIKDLRL